MRQAVPLLLLFAIGCSNSHDPLGTDDAGRPDGAVTCLENGCCTNPFGGYDCTNVPPAEGCPYPCCVDGVPSTCFIQAGYECAGVQGFDCGDGTCSNDPGGCG